MGTSTTKHSLWRPVVGDTGWGDLVSGNFETIDKLPYLKKGADVPSEAALFTTSAYPTDGNYFDVTGAVSITSMVTSNVVGTMIGLHFDSALTIVHDSTNLVLPKGLDIITEAGDELLFMEYASGGWRCIAGSNLAIYALKSVACQDNQVVCNNNEIVTI